MSHHDSSLPGNQSSPNGMGNPGLDGGGHMAPHVPMQPQTTFAPHFPMKPAAYHIDSNDTSHWAGHSGLTSGLFSAGVLPAADPAFAHLPDHSVLDLHTAL
jgi:hypothetical protein